MAKSSGYAGTRNIRDMSFIFMCVLFVLSNMAHAADSVLTLGVHPYLPAQEITNRFGPLVSYLGKELDARIELRISKDYESHIEHVGNNALDIAFMGPSSYISMTERYGEYPLLARLEVKGSPVFHGVIVARKDSQIKNVKQLAGKRFAFGSTHSTMSYLVPRYMLTMAGMKLEDLASYKFLGNHRNVMLGVLLDEFDAGAVKEEVYRQFKERGLVAIATSLPVSEHVFVARKGLDEKKIAAIKKAMYSLSAADEHKAILKSIKKGVTGLVPASHDDYRALQEMMNTVNGSAGQ